MESLKDPFKAYETNISGTVNILESVRKLDKKIKGVIITDISNRSPLSNLLRINDIIIEVQKTPIKTTADLKKIVNNIFKKGEKTLLLTIINQNNRRRYLGVKIN